MAGSFLGAGNSDGISAEIKKRSPSREAAGLPPLQLPIIAFIDGYDIGAIAFAAPSLIKEWHVAPKDLGVVLSASNFGVLFGSQIFGWIGDRYGRKTALILANFLFGVLTFAAAYSTNLTELSWLRFLAGLGIGGVIPNVVAINTESAPRNRRATLAIIATGMVPIGGALAGFASAALVPSYGWQVLFYIGGGRTGRVRARRDFRPAGIDQVHGAA